MGASAGLQFGSQGDGGGGLGPRLASAAVEFCGSGADPGAVPRVTAGPCGDGPAGDCPPPAAGGGESPGRPASGTGRAARGKTSAQAVRPADEAARGSPRGVTAELTEVSKVRPTPNRSSEPRRQRRTNTPPPAAGGTACVRR